ncbi:YHS domain-containing (seleno)protein [Roseobacter sp. HKCCA0434]|uniref:YHS domain-containing (seleno)protein n=1 Tax=Roseobacter sp. HKCCA0434 TaxID=3079297 RepID=UPI002905C3DF|nr:YHS domain-containing (seleno)protein [Roseobacter sp. HKCCA0434]
MTALTRRQTFALSLGAATLAALPAAAQEDAVFSTFLGGAIRGYDPVACFTEGAAVQGSRAFTSEHDGATWRFSSAENKALFDADPTAYAPQYGGYCAWAAAEGYTAPVDPEQWTIVDDKLYLNYSAEIQSRWETDIPGFIARADANWPSILD